MSKAPSHLLVLFADVVGSTGLYEKFGNLTAQHIISECMTILSGITYGFDGDVIKVIGDEILCTFPDPDCARLAACAMHTTMREASTGDRFSTYNLTIRVGMHWGEVIREGKDIFGDAVNVAARVVALTKSQQILTTRQTLDALPAEFHSTARFIDRTTVKGRIELLDLYEFIWEEKGLTALELGARTATAPANSCLHIRFNDTEIELGQHRFLLTIGRGEQNDLVVDDTHASRLHARIEFRRNKFILIDQSINGTYVQKQGEPIIHLRRDEMELRGEGIIGLGHVHDAGSKGCIYFFWRG